MNKSSPNVACFRRDLVSRCSLLFKALGNWRQNIFRCWRDSNPRPRARSQAAYHCTMGRRIWKNFICTSRKVSDGGSRDSWDGSFITCQETRSCKLLGPWDLLLVSGCVSRCSEPSIHRQGIQIKGTLQFNLLRDVGRNYQSEVSKNILRHVFCLAQWEKIP